MRVLVTGATGFIGGAIADRLAREGHEVWALVRSGSALAPRLRPVEGDLARSDGLEALPAVLEDADAVIHAATLRKEWGVDPALRIETNVAGTRRLLRLAAGVGRFVYVSSVAVYGHPETTPVSERSPMRPTTSYGADKVEAERIVAEEGEGPWTIVRPVITYGPGDTYGMIPQLLRLLRARRYLLVGNGRNRVHLVSIHDLLDGVLAALTRPEAAGEDFILAGPEPIRMQRLVELAGRAVARRPPPLKIPEQPARAMAFVLEGLWRALGRRREPLVTRGKIDIVCRDRSFSSEKAGRLLGYAPSRGYEQSLAEAARWLEGEGLL